MKLAGAALLVAAVACNAVPRDVEHTRCQRLEPFDDVADKLVWVTRDGRIGTDVATSTCHRARFRRWIGIERFDGNVDGKPRSFLPPDGDTPDAPDDIAPPSLDD